MTFRFSKRSLDILSTTNPDVQRVAKRALKITKIDFGFPTLGGKRTADEQYELFVAGSSQLDGISKKSYHQTGNALDVFAFVDGKASWDKYHLAMVAAAMLQAAALEGVELEWGGLWTSFEDYPHFQIPR